MATSREVIQTAYLQTLGRPADPGGLSFYSSQLESGRSLGDILKDLNYAASTGAEDVARNQQITAAGGWNFGPTTTPVTKPTTAPSGGITRDQAARIAAEIAPEGGYTQGQIDAWADWAIKSPDVLQSANPEQQLRNSILAAQKAAGETSTKTPVPITPPAQISGSPANVAARQEFVKNIRPYESPAAGYSSLESLYREMLGRNIDPEGRAFYGAQLASGQSLGDITQQIRGSTEYRNRPAIFQRGSVEAPQLGISGLPTGFQFMRAPPPAPVLNAPVSYLPFGVQDVAPVEAAPVETAPVGMAEGGMPRLSAKEAGSQFDISEYIDPKTGRFYINEYQRDVVFNPELREAERIERERISRMAKGGLASIAENLAEKGRGGDTMLVHMAPEEVAGLRGLAMQMGGDLSINPQTGLPEAKWLKKLLPLLPFALGPLGFLGKGFLSTLAGKSLLSGAIAGFTAPGKGFNFKEGLKTGITAFAGGKLFEALGSLGQTPGPAPGTSPPTVDPSMGGVSITGAPISEQVAASIAPPATTAAPNIGIADIGEIPGVTSFPGATPVTAGQAPITGPSSAPIAGVGANAPAPTLSSGLESLAKGTGEAAYGYVTRNPMEALLLGTSGYGLVEGEKERQAFKVAEAAKEREEEERRRQYADLFSRTLRRIPVAAGGGLVAMAQGGMPTFEYGGTTAPTGEPRMVKGAGDGMSDNVPANIEGVQEARLANDEFVVPADVVADIGNGSSNAGAKKLYAMMDRIRKARHGTTEQPPEIEAERLMPA